MKKSSNEKIMMNIIDLAQEQVEYSYWLIVIVILLLFLYLMEVIEHSYKRVKASSTPPTTIEENEEYIHFAANNCWRGSIYIDECRRLMNVYPFLINKPIMPYGYTPFLRACKYAHTELMSDMIELGADLSICTIFGDNPIYITTYGIITHGNNNYDALHLLISHGCDINMTNNNGYTPLHLAARYGQNKLVWWLTKNGAKQITPKCRYTPYEYALKYGQQITAELLMNDKNYLKMI